MGIRGLILSTISVVASMVFVTSASAQTKGFYIGAGAGAVLPVESDISGSGIETSTEFDATASGAFVAGYAFTHGLRTELEAAGRQASVASVSRSASGSGDVRVWNLMANVYWDFKNETDFVPYLGAGAGYALVDYDDVRPVGGSTIGDSAGAGAVAYQGVAGIGYTLSDRFSVFADYRYFGTGEAALQTRANADVDADYAEHRVTFGIKWSFSTDPSSAGRSRPPKSTTRVTPKPEARSDMKSTSNPPFTEEVPEISPSAGTATEMKPDTPLKPKTKIATAPRIETELKRNYLVFFEFDKTSLNPQDMGLIEDAANTARTAGITRIRTTGHADRAGPDPYNQRLSKRRAESVRAALIQRGVAASSIMMIARGERDPIVKTANGVKEPKNRRVEIVFE